MSGPEQRAALSNKPCEAVARACEETLAALAGDAEMSVEIRFAIHKHGDPSVAADGQRRLLKDELPPPDTDTDPEDDE
jgi:hypothetical protein